MAPTRVCGWLDRAMVEARAATYGPYRSVGHTCGPRPSATKGRSTMHRRPSRTNRPWTLQQRAFVGLAVVLCLVALGICFVRLQSDAAPAGRRDGAAPSFGSLESVLLPA